MSIESLAHADSLELLAMFEQAAMLSAMEEAKLDAQDPQRVADREMRSLEVDFIIAASKS